MDYPIAPPTATNKYKLGMEKDIKSSISQCGDQRPRNIAYMGEWWQIDKPWHKQSKYQCQLLLQIAQFKIWVPIIIYIV